MVIEVISDLICIQLSVCIIILSGFVDSIKSLIKRILTKGKMSGSDYSLRPFDCPLCMTFWCSLIYLICCHSLSIFYVALSLVLAWLTPVVNDLLVILKDKLIRIIGRI